MAEANPIKLVRNAVFMPFTKAVTLSFMFAGEKSRGSMAKYMPTKVPKMPMDVIMAGACCRTLCAHAL